MFVTAFNRTQTPVIIDDAGRVLGGLEWGTVAVTQSRTQDAVARGALVLVDITNPSTTASPVNDADARTAAAETRVQAAQHLSEAELDDALDAAGAADLYELALSTVSLPGS